MRDKLCIDIGGTKTLIGLIDSDSNIKESCRIKTSKDIKKFARDLKIEVKKFKGRVACVNVSFAGRVDTQGKVILAPNLPKELIGKNLIAMLNTGFKSVHIENDAVCFCLNAMNTRKITSDRSGLAIVWGTGIGGAVILFGKILKIKGREKFGEIGHIQTFNTDSDIESLIGGKGFKPNFGNDGEHLYKLASSGDKESIRKFREIGRLFGRYLLSLIYIFDPESIYIGGGVLNAWKFIKAGVEDIKFKNETVFSRVSNIYVSKDSYAMLKGAYFIDEKKNFIDKL